MCNCGGSGQWVPPEERGQAQQVVAATGPAAPGYYSEPGAPKVWNGPQPAPSKTDG